MVSASKDKKKTPTSRLSSKAASKNASGASSVNGDETPPLLDGDDNPIPEDEAATSADKMDTVKKLTDQMDKHGLSDRVTTGVLSSLATSRDVKIGSVSLVFHGKVLLQDTVMELNFGRRYGLLGENGCGKSTLLKAIDKREYPIPEAVDIYLLNEGAPPSDLGALEWVVKEAENELNRLDKLAETILENEGPESPILEDLYEVRSMANDRRIMLTAAAYGIHGSIDFPNSCLAHSYWSRFQQEDYPEKDKGHVGRMEDASCSRKGSFCQTITPSP
jgi:ATP-binding cassette subfamily F protein 2